MFSRPKIAFLFFCIILFSCVNVFSQQADTQVVKPEFQEIDIDTDGSITAEEMQAYQVKRFQELDQDKSGVIETDEAEADQTKMHQPADKDKDNKITQNESDAQFREYFQQMDKNNDNKIDAIEYTDYWKGIYYF